METLNKIAKDIPEEGVAKEKLAELLGYKSLNGPARALLASLVGYGLLSRRPFKISPLGQTLLENGEALPARRRAALMPKVYRMIFRRAKGLPGEEIAKRLMKHRFTEEGAKRAVEVFNENYAFAQLDSMDPAKVPGGGPKGRRARMGKRGQGPNRPGMQSGPGRRGRGQGPHGPRRRPGPPPSAMFRVPVGEGKDAELRFFGGRPDSASIDALRKYLQLIESTL